MKKSLWVFGIVMLAGAVAFPLTLWAVDREKGKITVRETVLSGDPGQAAGLRVEMGTHWDSRLLWETGFEPGRTGEADSRFSFSAAQVPWRENPTSYVHLDIPSDRGTGRAVDGNSGRTVEREIDIGSDPMALLLQAVAERTASGEERTEILAVRDYFERYPAVLSASNGETAGEQMIYLADTWDDGLAEIFDLRVPEDALAEVTIRKNNQGAVTGFKYTIRGGYYLTGTSAFGNDGCFYGFRRENKDDYGIVDDGADCWLYFLPYMGGKERRVGWVQGIDTNGIVNVCTLPAGVAPVELVLDEREERLYLAARDESRYYVFVYGVDGRSLTLLQQIPILERGELQPGAEGFWRDYRQMQVQEDGILITWGGNLFVFLAKHIAAGEDKGYQYRVWCSDIFPLGEIKEESENESSWERLAEMSVFADENTFAFDGERLALAAVDRWGDLSTRLLIYRDGQMVYSGFYQYSGELDKAFGTWEGYSIQAQGAAGRRARRSGRVQNPLRVYFEP